MVYLLLLLMTIMIINLLINFILLVFGSLFVFFPEVHLIDIPVFGSLMVDYLTWAVTTWNSFLETFPYAQTAWQMLLFVVLPFELLMLVAKFFLGHRMPINK